MSSGTNSERITQNNGIITDNNTAIDNFKTAITNLPSRDNNANVKTEYTNQYQGIELKNMFIEIPDLTITYTSNNIMFSATFQQMPNILEAPMITITSASKIKNTSSMFTQCINLETTKQYDLSECSNTSYMYNNDAKLKNVPIYDLSSVTNIQGMYRGCNALTNDSLNNILYSLARATAYINQGTNMTLAYVGLSQDQATTCQTLSNWQDCVTAGWTTGY